jgi:type VI secretion system protein ImpK
VSNGDDKGRRRTVFRPSGLPDSSQPPPPDPFTQRQGAPPPAPPAANYPPPNYPPPNYPASNPPPQYADPYAPPRPQRLRDDDIPQPATAQAVRNRLVAEAGPVLALAASVRSGRARTPMPELHRQASSAIAAFDRAIQPHYPDETRQRAKYALCATFDDIAQNLPGAGADGAEWARRSMVVQFFQENIGGDRFWQLVDHMLARPAQNADLIELFHACLAAGFEGRFRVMPDGKRRLYEIMAQLYGALEHPRSLSDRELVRSWKGVAAPLRKVGLWNYVMLAAAAAAGLLLVIYIVLLLILSSSGEASSDAVAAITPEEPLRLSRAAAPPPEAPASGQAAGLRQFLKPEIDAKEVVVEEDGSTVRVRTTVGQLFQSASDELEAGREDLFRRIGQAVEKEPGTVTVEGHADSDRVSSPAFPDNTVLSEARANRVAEIVRAQLSDKSRVVAQGFGDSRPIASNSSAAGKSMNRRVEITVPRRN